MLPKAVARSASFLGFNSTRALSIPQLLLRVYAVMPQWIEEAS
jgi:hypothetical protein